MKAIIGRGNVVKMASHTHLWMYPTSFPRYFYVLFDRRRQLNFERSYPVQSDAYYPKWTLAFTHYPRPRPSTIFQIHKYLLH
jgi:hypothetical protein